MSKAAKSPINVAKGINGAGHGKELQLQQVRLIPSDNSVIESRRAVKLTRRFDFIHAGSSFNAVPIIAANMFGTGTIQMAEVFHQQGMLVAMEKHTDVKRILSFLKDHGGNTAIPSVGFTKEDNENLKTIFKGAGNTPPRSIIIDVPNGHMQKMVDTIKEYRKNYPFTVIIAGNVATGSMARELVKAGADAVKVGIGPGSACTTKLIAGTHRPQFAAIRECAAAVHSLGGYIVADGGVKTAGDAAIALAAGGDFVMMGGALSAHDQSGEPIYVDKNGNEWQEFMGSSSAAYMTRTKGEVAHYRAAEGELQWIPHKGSIEEPGAILQEVLGGLRSAFSYAGAKSIKQFAQMAKATYLGEKGGLRLVKAEIGISGGKSSSPALVDGKFIDARPSPLRTEEEKNNNKKEPRPELYMPK